MHKQKYLPYFIDLLMGILIICILTSCNLGTINDKQSQSSKKYTEVAETVAVQLTAKATNRTQPVPSSTQQQGEKTILSETPVITPTAAITEITELQPEPTNSNTPTIVPCNWALFVTDVTYLDNTEVPANTEFVKTWRLQNIGSCAWNSNYKIVFHSGDRLGAPDEQPISPETIASGGIVDVSINLKSPSEPGTYQAYFMLKDPDGKLFGIGDNANGTFYVKIIVPNPSKTPTDSPTSTFTPTFEMTNTIMPTDTTQP